MCIGVGTSYEYTRGVLDTMDKCTDLLSVDDDGDVTKCTMLE